MRDCLLNVTLVLAAVWAVLLAEPGTVRVLVLVAVPIGLIWLETNGPNRGWGTSRRQVRRWHGALAHPGTAHELHLVPSSGKAPDLHPLGISQNGRQQWSLDLTDGPTIENVIARTEELRTFFNAAHIVVEPAGPRCVALHVYDHDPHPLDVMSRLVG